MKLEQRFPLTPLLYFDGLAALVVGIFLLAARQPFSEFLGLPVWLLTLQGAINFCYASYSLFLARRRRRPLWMLRMLVVGNLAYALFAAVLLVQFYPTCNVWGVVYFLLEVAIIGGLGLVEWAVVREVGRTLR